MRAVGTFTVKTFTPTELVPDPPVPTGVPVGVATMEKQFEGEVAGRSATLFTFAVGSIVDGSAIYQIEGQPASRLRAGDVFYEPEGARIARFDATEEGVTFLGYFLLGPQQDPEISLPER
jgi:Protein of unknown function (DUF3224)